MPNTQIMIVEDDALVAMFLEKQLKHLGYQVAAVVYSGENAVQQAIKIHPDLILMDIHLEGQLNGLEAAAQIHEQLDVPIIFLTGHIDMFPVEQAENDKFNYLLKPFEKEDLQTAIRKALRQHK